jgi:serine/threonine protein kinase
MDSDEFPTFGLTLPPDPSGSLVGCVIHDRYTLEEPIGRGGFGCVFRARQKSPSRMVAIKVSRHHADNADRMVREANLLATLDHPAIARVFDAGTWDSPIGRRVYVVMELVSEAERFDHYCHKYLPRVHDRLNLFIRVCNAVGVAHARGIVHRDLKPGNVLVGEAGHPKVIDFGIAKVLSDRDDGDAEHVATVSETADAEDGTRTGAFMGTPPYASPEQMAGEPVTSRSDVHALGKLFADMLSDRPRRLPTTLRRVVDRCTRPLAEQRYADANTLAAVLEGWVGRRRMATRLSLVAAGIVVVAVTALGLTRTTALPPREPIAGLASQRDPVPLRPGSDLPEVEAGVMSASDGKGRWFIQGGTGRDILVARQERPLDTTGRPQVSPSAIRSLRFDATGDHLATTDGNHWRLWVTRDFEANSTGLRIQMPPAHGKPDGVGACLELSADGRRLFGQIGEHDLVAIDVPDGLVTEPVSVAPARITAIARSADPDIAYVGSSDGTVALWDVGRRSLKALDRPHGAGSVMLASTPHGTSLASIGVDETLCLRGADGRAMLTAPGLGSPQALSFADDTRLVVATRTGLDSRSRVTRFEIPPDLTGGPLVVTGTAEVPERILHLSASGTTFLAVTLDRAGVAVTEIWAQPDAATVSAGGFSPPTVARASR